MRIYDCKKTDFRPTFTDRVATAATEIDDEQHFVAEEHDVVTSVVNVDHDEKVTNTSLSYIRDIGNMTITQSAKSMLDMLDDLSMSEGLLSDISFGHIESEVSRRINRLKPEVESRSPLRPRTSKPNSKASNQAPSSSSHRYRFKLSQPTILYIPGTGNLNLFLCEPKRYLKGVDL